MADFYPVLARAVSRLADGGYQARQELYDHARGVLVAQLRERDPGISAPQIMREQAALETAIREIEDASNAGQIETAADWRSHRPMANGSSAVNWSAQQPPFSVASEASFENALPARDALLTSAVAWERPSDIIARRNSRTSKKAKTRPLSVQAKEFDPSDEPALRRIMPLTIVLLVIVPIAAIFFPIILMNNPRVIWLSEHLIDNPQMLAVIAITPSLLLLLFLPILGRRRKRSAIGFLRRLLSMQPTSA